LKKLFIGILLLCVIFSVSGCTVMHDLLAPSVLEETVFTVDDYNLQITADSNFQQNASDNFDLQINNIRSYISIMAYKYIDLAQNTSPQDIYDWQNEDMFSRRENVTVVEPTQTQNLPQCTIVRTLYSAESAESSGVKNYYASYLVDFPEEETFAWVVVTALPSYFEKNSEYLHDIVASLSILP